MRTISNFIHNFSFSSGLCRFRLNNLLRPAMNHGIGWTTEDTPDPSFKSGEKKDAFEGAFGLQRMQPLNLDPAIVNAIRESLFFSTHSSDFSTSVLRRSRSALMSL
ncbi:hypothetical protein AMECASPLE_024950 [Ameca splendens]|uniref:Uncharacterized protein n=1 Tax=Ameca splendens TaxID=208324 RepID=A0ABV0Y4F0_9TELE